MTIAQVLTLKLDGITAGDYLAWVHDPKPAALDHGLHSLEVRAGAGDDEVEALLWWTIPAPSPLVAARAAGLPLTPEVVELWSRTLAVVSSRRDARVVPAARAA
ncbi:MAG TPA: hypothetical protein VF752_11375 [Thermoleophilaceae bacterium]